MLEETGTSSLRQLGLMGDVEKTAEELDCAFVRSGSSSTKISSIPVMAWHARIA
jgi:hypothetical protein